MKKNLPIIILGIVLIAIGAIAILNIFDVFPVDVFDILFFEGWWTLFIIIPGILTLFRKGSKFFSLVMIFVGVALLLNAQGVPFAKDLWKILVPALIIFAGIALIFRHHDYSKIKIDDCVSPDGTCDITAVFSGCEKSPKNEFKGGNVVAIFGGGKLDLRDAVITENVVIKATTVFGGLDLFVPQGVKVVLKDFCLCGGIDNHSKGDTEDGPTIFIDGFCLFGGIDIK